MRTAAVDDEGDLIAAARSNADDVERTDEANIANRSIDEPDERDVEERKECERAINDDTPTEPAGAISYDRNKKNCGIFQVQEANVSTQELVQSMTREE